MKLEQIDTRKFLVSYKGQYTTFMTTDRLAAFMWGLTWALQLDV